METHPSASEASLISSSTTEELSRFSVPDSQLIKILLISDSQTQHGETLTEILAKSYLLYVADSSEQGVMFLHKHCPQLILCDLECSRISGLIEALKQADFCHVPLLLVTNSQQKPTVVRFLGKGVADYLVLPFEEEELQLRIRIHLQLSRARSSLRSSLHVDHKSVDELVQMQIQKTDGLEKINRMKDEFFAILSHELRNPINVIAGFAEILKTDEATSELGKKAACAIYRSAQIQVKLISDLLEISKSISGKMILDCKPMDLKALVEETLLSLAPTAEAKQIRMSFTTNGQSGIVFGDSIRLSQVIWNLLTNAIKFTPSEGQVQLSLKHVEQWVDLTIHDTGTGINPEFIPQMFEKFHQQDSEVTKNFGGLGLGLAIVRHIVELHGGSVTACSEGLGKGATFTVRLPALPN